MLARRGTPRLCQGVLERSLCPPVADPAVTALRRVEVKCDRLHVGRMMVQEGTPPLQIFDQCSHLRMYKGNLEDEGKLANSLTQYYALLIGNRA